MLRLRQVAFPVRGCCFVVVHRNEILVQIDEALLASGVRVDDVELATMESSEIADGEFTIQLLAIALMNAGFVLAMVEKQMASVGRDIAKFVGKELSLPGNGRDQWSVECELGDFGYFSYERGPSE